MLGYECSKSFNFSYKYESTDSTRNRRNKKQLKQDSLYKKKKKKFRVYFLLGFLQSDVIGVAASDMTLTLSSAKLSDVRKSALRSFTFP